MISGNTEAITIVEVMCPSPNLSHTRGIGGNAREVGIASDVPSGEGPQFAHDQVRDQLRKVKKLLVRRQDSQCISADESGR